MIIVRLFMFIFGDSALSYDIYIDAIVDAWQRSRMISHASLRRKGTKKSVSAGQKINFLPFGTRGLCSITHFL